MVKGYGKKLKWAMKNFRRALDGKSTRMTKSACGKIVVGRWNPKRSTSQIFVIAQRKDIQISNAFKDHAGGELWQIIGTRKPQ